VVGQDSGEFGFVFWLEQVFDSAFREFSESGVGRGEHGEWSFAGKCLGEAGRFNGRDQGGKIFIAGGDFDHVLRWFSGVEWGDDGENGRGGEGDVFFHRIKTIPHDIVFDNNGLVHLSSLETIPSNILFSNKGNVYLDSLRNIPKEVVFDNRGSVNLPYGWNHNWDGNIEGICYDILFNKMISLGLFDR
jgi:hypothetical protein